MLGCGLINARLSVVSGLLVLYHWWELPQVVLSPHKFCHNKCVCHDKNMFVLVVTTKHVFFLSWQKYAGCDKTCLSWQIFVVTKVLSQQKRCCNKHNFGTTKVLSQQAYFCHDKRCVLLWQTRVCHDKHMLAATKVLSQQKWYLRQLLPVLVLAWCVEGELLCCWC